MSHELVLTKVDNEARFVIGAASERTKHQGAINAAMVSYLSAVPAALHEASKFHLAQPGKQLRAVIAYQAATHFGVSSERALGWASAVELLHNASLIHDDLCDGDLQRRGRDTVFKRFGESIALCLGDYYIATAFAILAEIDAPARCSAMFARHFQAIIGGQASEFVFIGYPAWQAYQSMAIAKTAPLLSLPVIGAQYFADGSKNDQAITDYFESSALCFQIANDLRNFSGSDGANSPCSDLANCRPNAVIANFRTALNAREGAIFDIWADRIRSGQLIADTVETRQWWQKVKSSTAFAQTSDLLRQHFDLASSRLKLLPAELIPYVFPFHSWLGVELKQLHKELL